MRVYAYSEARQKLASALNKAAETDMVIIKRRDGRKFAVTPHKEAASPLDVPSINVKISTEELVGLIRAERGRTRGMTKK